MIETRLTLRDHDSHASATLTYKEQACCAVACCVAEYATFLFLRTKTPRHFSNNHKYSATAIMTFLEGYRSSTVNRWVQRLLRVLQFLCSIIALGLFSRRLARLIHLTRRSYNRGEGAVEGILAAATVYSILAMAMACCLRHGGPKIIRWLFVLLDILFLGAFIAVAALTRPHNGPAGPYGGECRRDSFLANAITRDFRRRHGCNLPWGTFVLAIISW